ncbi:MAG: NUDIX hydrolase [Myxococcota bacterium]|nr:NUDIX hydrolase [Myxococcota bacterium]
MPPIPRFCSQCAASLEQRIVEGRQREVCPRCGTICYRNPTPVAAALVLDDQQRLLLVRRGQPPQQGLWCLPTGFAELGESIAEAALRELHEEAGLGGEVRSLVDVDSYVSDFYGDLVIVTYEVAPAAGPPCPGSDAVAVGWFAFDALPPLAFSSNERALALLRQRKGI